MINLLPPEQKKELALEERWRLVLILGILVLAFLVSQVLILFSVKIFIEGQAESQKIIFEQKKEELNAPEIQAIEKQVKSINQNLLKLNSFYRDQMSFVGPLERIGKIPSLEMYFSALSLSIFPEREFQVLLAGFSPTRETLFKFKKNLEAEEDFKEIYFPPTNWVEPIDIDFSARFKVQ